MTIMASTGALESLLSGDYLSALEKLNKEDYPLEYAYAVFLAGNFELAKSILATVDSIRANWLKELILLMTAKKMEAVTYFQIRNFLELDIDLFIKAQKINYLEKLLGYSEVLSEVNKESYKLIGRILFNNHLRSLAKFYLDKYKDEIYYDPELHFIYSKFYLIRFNMCSINIICLRFCYYSKFFVYVINIYIDSNLRYLFHHRLHEVLLKIPV